MTALSTLTLALFITIGYTNGQVNNQRFQQKVLQKAIVDSTFIFGKWTQKGGTETHLKYLGQVTTKHGQTFRILNSIWIWGLSRRATSTILVFNSENRFIGFYHLTLITDLPTKMDRGNLIFKNTHGDCDENLTTVIDLKNGLPKQFFRKCKGKYGDIYSFETE